MRNYKHVTNFGLPFIVHSSREREATLGDRHFFAIGSNSRGWTLFEHDRSINEHGEAIPIGRKFERLFNTKALVEEIRRLVDDRETLPTDIRPPWVIDEARFQSLHPVQTRHTCDAMVRNAGEPMI